MEAQRSKEWHEKRFGKFTPSQFYRLMTEPKLKADKEANNLSQGALTYVLERVAEHITGKSAIDEFASKATEWGVEYEPIAVNLYERVFDVKTTENGYIECNKYIGGSPDRLIGKDGILEVKCPYTITAHLEHILLKSLKDKQQYYWQCLGYLLITGRKWIDFISYSPHYPPKKRLKQIRINAIDVKDDLEFLFVKLTKATQEFNNLINNL